MGIIKDRYVKNATVLGPYSTIDSALVKALGLDANILNSNKFGETIYFICLKHLVETMSKLDKYLYNKTIDRGKERKDSPWINVLNREPNPIYTATTLWSSAELNRLHYGNAYVYIENQGISKYLWLLPSEEIEVYIDDAGVFDKVDGSAKNRGNPVWYVWRDSKSKKQFLFNANEIMHFKTHISEDGFMGLSVKDILKTQIESLKYSQSFQGNLFKNNMFGGKILLQYTGDLNKNAKDTLVTETERYANSVGTGKFLPIPLGITATNLDMKLTDAEFVALNQLSGLQLAACFGIKPNVINDYSKSSYSNSETQQLDFYVNSLQPIFKMYGDELSKKILNPKEKEQNYFYEIDKEALFELDKKTQMEILVQGVNNFIITPQEAREKIGYPYIEDENANKLYGNGNLIELSIAGKGGNYAKGGAK